ncbi:RagB/SusD family nutrient uptake outer membrane protein [Daejeonella oryzae]|uniref:RagB/SusD family nutrient uptake outer membrane protein n=1 Tax=Daejeonella oryzae TaxID=1122943 RepID=UPI0003F62202|nr:RagB/SusD family nutrient uptake outer membrane protein [Daejeonella oryzae]
MKIKYILAISAGLTLSLNSCEKKLALTPEQDLTEETIFNSASTARSAVLGIYSTAQTLEFSGSLPQLIGEYMGDNVEFVGSFPTLQELRDFTTVSTNTNISGLWQVHYQVITRANKVIAQIGNVPGLTDAEKSQFVGEAKFMRALAYFQLADMFAQPFQVSNGSNLAVPLVLEDFTGTITFPARNTLNEVHTQIQTDLEEASVALPASYATGIDTRGRATKGAAFALLSRLKLYREEWPAAVTAARAALATGQYALAADYSFYDKNTAEDVFTIQNSAVDNGRTGSGGWAAYFRPTAVGGRGDAPFSASLIAAYEAEPGDLRYALKSSGTAADGLTRVFSTKYPDAVNNSDNSPVLRTTEVYLNLAEALARQTALSPEAITILNNLRSRAGLAPKLVFATQQSLVDAILLERRKELAFEGHRRMDILRNRGNLRQGVTLAAFGGEKTILPIPQREVDNNPSLVPNPGY